MTFGAARCLFNVQKIGLSSHDDKKGGHSITY